MNILDRILRDKAKEVAAAKKIVPLALIKKAALRLPRKRFGLRKALNGQKKLAVIAEIKRRSPSKGLLARRFDPARIAGEYGKAGAAAISVLTDEKYFGGSPSFVSLVKRAVALPVLRKDFVVDEYQVYETRLMGADAFLLIARTLTKKKMRSFYRTAQRLGLDVLFEVHDAAELKKVLALKPVLVGVNNRDLGTFRVDFGVSIRLSRLIPEKIIFVSESGIHTGRDLRLLEAIGADAALVGESLMRDKHPGKALQRLLRHA
jgi:indole-3-glycerol phosphate synthase